MTRSTSRFLQNVRHTITSDWEYKADRSDKRTVTMTIETEYGKIEIAPAAIASIASQVVLESYGVVGIASRNFKDGLVELLAPGASHRGVDVKVEGGKIFIDLYVILEYGIRISEVAQNIMSVVKFRVEKALGMPVTKVNVHVQALRVSTVD